VVELAVVPAGAIGLLEVQHRDLVLLGESTHVAAELVAVFWMMTHDAIGWPRWTSQNRFTWLPT
jgi:hypothetical protein